jgi:thiamine-monophosphate kinase
MNSTGEFDRIRAMLDAASSARGGGILIGPGDDASVLDALPGESFVVSTDMSVEGIHFRREWLAWEAIGYRAAAVALSDMAAMAARPVGVLVSLAMPPELDRSTYEQFSAGMAECLKTCEASLLGGDTSSSPSVVFIDVTAIGTVGTPVTRAGARPGDEVWVTGRLGAAAAAVLALNSGLEPEPVDRSAYERPVPRWREARWLAERAGVTAAIDISDGLVGDAGHLSAASECELSLEIGRIPLADSLQGWADRSLALTIATGGGDDYELLFSVPPGILEAIAPRFTEEFELDLTRVGSVNEGSGVCWIGAGGGPVDPPARAGYEHFTDQG